jgi:hypothetical protein
VVELTVMSKKEKVVEMTSTDTASSGKGIRVQLLHVPDCPLAPRVRTMLRECLDEARMAAVVEDMEGEYPSPTVLVNGVDVVTGRPASGDARCRLDLPTRDQILGALRRS